MKNTIPIIIAVLLAVAAVFAVSKVVSENDEKGGGEMVQIVVADQDLSVGATFEEENLAYREVPEDAVPQNALLWRDVKVAWGQPVPRAIGDGESVLVSDVRRQLSLSDCARDGEWTIPVSFANATLVPMLRPDDEIAILATWSVNEGEAADGPGAGKQTTLLMPCVRVHGIVGSNGSFRGDAGGEGGGASTILVSLPPQEAEMLVAVQSIATLTPVLRKRNDPAARQRTDGGMITSRTFKMNKKQIRKMNAVMMEYVLIAVLIAAAVVGAVMYFGKSAATGMSTAADAIVTPSEVKAINKNNDFGATSAKDKAKTKMNEMHGSSK